MMYHLPVPRVYIDIIISCFNLEGIRPASKVIEPRLHLSTNQYPTMPAEILEMKNIPYHEAIGSLMYATLNTCPNISFTITILSLYMVIPGRPHWEAAKLIFRYLKTMRDLPAWCGLNTAGE